MAEHPNTLYDADSLSTALRAFEAHYGMSTPDFLRPMPALIRFRTSVLFDCHVWASFAETVARLRYEPDAPDRPAWLVREAVPA